MIYLSNKGKRGQMLIGFLPNKESARETRVNPLQLYYGLSRRAGAEKKCLYATFPETPSFTKELLFLSPATQSEAPTVNKAWLEMFPSTLEAQGAKPAQEESEGMRIVPRQKMHTTTLEAEGAKPAQESDGRTAQWIGDRPQLN